MKKRYWIYLLAISGMLLTSCDFYPYKRDIQREYDEDNPNGDKAVCMMVASVRYSEYPYITHHIEGEDLPFNAMEDHTAFFNRLDNESFHYFTELGFFTEEDMGMEDDKPIYRYELTDLGKQYVDWALGGTNFCFGRIVVDSIDRTKDSINGVGGGALRDVYITYHVENIPDWVKNSDVYILYRYSQKVATGEKMSGIHTYKVLGNNKLETIVSVSGRYRWATRSDSKSSKTSSQ